MKRTDDSETIIRNLREVDNLVSEGRTIGEALSELGFRLQLYQEWLREYGGYRIEIAPRKELCYEFTFPDGRDFRIPARDKRNRKLAAICWTRGSKFWGEKEEPGWELLDVFDTQDDVNAYLNKPCVKAAFDDGWKNDLRIIEVRRCFRAI